MFTGFAERALPYIDPVFPVYLVFIWYFYILVGLFGLDLEPCARARSSAFLMGPLSQLKRMVDPARRVATAVYVVLLLITLMCVRALRGSGTDGFLLTRAACEGLY